jgi:glucose/mannose transport system substrate-binding protein
VRAVRPLRFRPGTGPAALALALVLTVGGRAEAQPTAEVFHYWTSGGESKAMAVLKRDFEVAGGLWIDSPVAGGGGDAAAAVLRLRLLAGDPPNAVQLKGQNIREWASEGVLVPLDDLATTGGWDDRLPPVLRDVVKYQGHYVAVPVNIHRVNWLWANPKVLARVGVAVPGTWDEFNAAATKLAAAGVIPLAHGGDPWQDAMLFETVAVGIGGAEFYRKALIEHDEPTLRSGTMRRVFDEMRTLSGFVDPNYPGRDWSAATSMVMDGRAAFQINGDWVKGEFLAAGKEPVRDFLCAPAPGEPGYVLNSDSFVMFRSSGADRAEGQKLLAGLLFGPRFQETFNLYKGSIPARLDTPMERFDSCSLRSRRDLEASMADSSLVLSVSNEMALDGATRGAILDVVTEHFNSAMPSAEAMDRLVAAIRLVE